MAEACHLDSGVAVGDFVHDAELGETRRNAVYGDRANHVRSLGQPTQVADVLLQPCRLLSFKECHHRCGLPAPELATSEAD